MDKTVQPDKKLMTETSMTPNASMTGLMMTPPMPQMAPMVDAKNAIAAIRKIITRC